MNKLFVLFLAVCLTVSVGAQQLVNTGKDATAVGGFDPVAYFIDGKATEGDPRISLELDGAVYQFASSSNKSLFEADPEAYLPEYGGYCAWAVGQGYSADIDPEAWTIHDDRLFLNYNRSIRRKFQSDIENSIAGADSNWPTVKSNL